MDRRQRAGHGCPAFLIASARSIDMRTDKQQMTAWLDNIPDLYQGSFRKQWLKAATKSSMRQAVNAKCADCTNWQNVEIRECTVITCPLYQYRPRSATSKSDAERRKAVLSIAQAAQKEFVTQCSASSRALGKDLKI